MLNVLLQEVDLRETNSRCGPREADDMTPCQYCFLGHATRTADRPLSVHQPRSSSAERIASHSADSPPNITQIKKKACCKGLFIIALLFWKYRSERAEVQIIALQLLVSRLLMANILQYNFNITGCGWPLTGNTGNVGQYANCWTA